MNRKIVHLTSVHTRYDTRIFLKMCTSLAQVEEFNVYLVVADGKGDEVKNNVQIIDTGKKTGGRLKRMTQTTKQVYLKALALNADLYHIHDPELIPTGIKLKKQGKKVIFDAHEDLPKQILSKPYLNRWNKLAISKALHIYEQISCSKFDFIFTATPTIRDKFLKINTKSIDINNYPILGELSNQASWSEKLNEVCFVGGMSYIRGVKEFVEAAQFITNVKFNLVGDFSDRKLHEDVKNSPAWCKMEHLGFLDRKGVAQILKQSKAGLVTFHEVPNHTEAQPNKMFEYMSSGLPVISSHFPLWREIVEGNNCGLCVDPMNPKAIANAIEYIMNHPEEASMMGQNGKKAVLEKYNWSVEEKKMIQIYKELLK